MLAALTEDSPRFDVGAADGGAALRVKPYMHQEAGVCAMRRLEDSRDEPLEVLGDARMVTCAGVLADKPGAGKSYTVLCHLLTRPVIDRQATRTTQAVHMGGIVRVTHTLRSSSVLETNLVVVPRGTHAQWAAYLRDMTDFPDDLTFARATCKDSDLAEIISGRYGIVILTETVYRRLSDMPGFDEVTFQRLVLDEADSIHIPSFQPPNVIFTWYVTATPARLFDCPATVRLRSTIGNRHSADLARNLVVRSAPAFVDAALRLPAFTEETVTVTRPRIHSVIRSMIPAEVMTAIEACDIDAAVARLGCTAGGSEESIVYVIQSMMQRNVTALEESVEGAPDALVPSLLARIQRAKDGMASIADRIRETDCCPISLDTIATKAITPCCKNAFEFANLLRALDRSPGSNCPLCKAVISPKEIFVVNGTATPEMPAAGASTAPAAYTTKMAALSAVLDRVRGARTRPRVLIFSSYDMGNSAEVCQEKGLRVREVKGNAGVVRNTVEQFTNGAVDVLLLNADHFAAGLNLQAATDIITVHRLSPERYTQLVGRAQRPGRTQPLAVYNIEFEGEM